MTQQVAKQQLKDAELLLNQQIETAVQLFVTATKIPVKEVLIRKHGNRFVIKQIKTNIPPVTRH